MKLSEVIYSWKTTTEPNLVTWETVIAAFEEECIIKNKVVVDKVRRHLIKGKNAFIVRVILN